MSEPPFSDNLICDYLDNQLSSAARAEFESRLVRDPKLRELVDRLRRQADECAALPKFKLDDRFAERLLDRPELQSIFRGYSAGRAPTGLSPAGIWTAYPPRAAAAAIASLVALVLITVLLQIPGADENMPVARKPVDDKAKSSETRRDKSISEKNTSSSTPDEAPKSAALKGNESVIAVDQPEQDAKEEPGPLNLQLGAQPEADEEMGRQSVNSVDRRASDAREGVNKQELDTDSFARAQIADDPSPREADQVLVTRGADAIQYDQAESTVELNDVIEINYAGGPEKLAEFRSALIKNEIAIDAGPRGNLRQENLADEKRSADDAESGRGLGGRDSDLASQRKNGLASNIELGLSTQLENEYPDEAKQVDAQTDSNSQAFLITATPDQMAGLITDLQDQADVSAFRLFTPTPTPEQLNEMQFQLETDKAAGLSGLPREPESQSLADTDAVRGQFDQQAPQPSAVPGTAVEQRQLMKQDRRSLSIQSGLATQLEPQISWRNQRTPGINQAAQGNSQSMKSPGNPNLLSQQLGDGSTGKLELLNRYFGSIDKDMPTQRYLLMVRLNEPATDSSAALDFELAPPAAADPGDGDH